MMRLSIFNIGLFSIKRLPKIIFRWRKVYQETINEPISIVNHVNSIPNLLFEAEISSQ